MSLLSYAAPANGGFFPENTATTVLQIESDMEGPDAGQLKILAQEHTRSPSGTVASWEILRARPCLTLSAILAVFFCIRKNEDNLTITGGAGYAPAGGGAFNVFKQTFAGEQLRSRCE